jgi:hypothetical protein
MSRMAVKVFHQGPDGHTRLHFLQGYCICYCEGCMNKIPLPSYEGQTSREQVICICAGGCICTSVAHRNLVAQKEA